MNSSELYGWFLSKVLYDWRPFKKRTKKRFYQKFIKEKDLILDIGSHMGDRTDTFLQLGAQVVAIEPQPIFHNHLLKKYKRQDKVTVIDKAISNKEGKTQFHISSKYPTISTIADQEWVDSIKNATSLNIDYNKTIDVDLTTIDKLTEKHGAFAFVKIDVEGHELEVLQGMTKTTPAVSFEFLSFSFDRLHQCLSYLDDMGYNSFNWSQGESFKFNMQDNTASIQELYDHVVAYDSKKTFGGDVYAWKKRNQYSN